MVTSVKRHPPEILQWVPARQRVLYADTDAMGIVYHGTYLRFFETGRNEYFRACGASYDVVERAGYHLVVIEIGAKYRAPARFDDDLLIETGMALLGPTRLLFRYRLRRASTGELLTEGFTEHACVDHATRKPVRLPRVVLDHTVLRPHS